jgi:VWFA-related protein
VRTLLPAVLLVAACLAVTQAQPASVVIVSPGADDLVSGPVVVSARVEPPGRRPRKVTIYADGRHLCTLERAPFDCAWDAGTSLNEHEVRVVATFDDGSRAVAKVRTRGMGYVEAVDVRVIQVPVVVTDGGKFVRGLTRKDFSVREDGVPQQVTFFAAEDSPLEVVVAVDVSGSMVGAIPTLKLAVKQFLTALRPTDRVTVLGFNDMVFTLAKNAVDLDERLAAIDELSAWGGTAMYDAAIRALGLLGKRPGRKALVMFTDGEDRVSRMTEDDAGARLETGNVMFYAVGQGQAMQVPNLRQTLDRFARTSGGRAFFEPDERNLVRVFQEIVEELSHHYLLGYAPSRGESDGSWRKIEVRLTGGKKFRVRAREGYRAAAPARGGQ